MKRGTLVRGVLGVVALVAGCADAQTITSLGTWSWSGPPQLGLGYAGVSSRAEAINADGSAVACSVYMLAGQQGPLASRWTPSVGMTTTSCGWYSESRAITPDGLQLAGVNTFGSPSWQACRWPSFGGCATSLGSLGTQVPNQVPVALGMSASGGLVVGHGHIAGAPFGSTVMPQPFMWTPGGGIVTTPHPAGRNQGVMRAVSTGAGPNGTVIVGESGWQDGFVYGYHREAAYWDSLGVHQMGWMASGVDSVASACSADGSVIVGAADIQYTGIVIPSPGPVHAFRWQGGSYQDLGLMPNAPVNGWSAAQAVSANGEVVLGKGLEGASDIEAFIWRSDFGMARLEDVLGWLGMNLSGWDLNEVTGISADSQSLCGNGTYNGVSVGWVINGLPPLCGPIITTQPQSNTVCVGDSVTLFTTGFWGGPTATQWYRLYPVGGGLYIQFPINNGPQPGGSFITGAYTQFMNMSGASPSDAGLYAAVVWSGCSSAQTVMATLTVRTLPEFVTLPQLTTYVDMHGNFTLSVSVTSSWGETPTYQWKRNNVPLVDGPTCGETVFGAQTPTLTMTNCYGIDAGTYGIDVTGYCGTIGAGAQVILCPADLDDGTNTGTPDGGVDLNDLLYFLNEYALGNMTADLDDGFGFGQPDCGPDLNDLVFFLGVYGNGC